MTLLELTQDLGIEFCILTIKDNCDQKTGVGALSDHKDEKSYWFKFDSEIEISIDTEIEVFEIEEL